MQSLNPDQVKIRAKQLISADEFAWLTEKRWFADKGKPISETHIADFTISELADETVFLTIVDVRFLDGSMSRYFVPLMRGVQGGRDENDLSLVDATTQPVFGRWLAELLLASGSLPVSTAWTVSRVANVSPRLHDRGDVEGRPVGGEQSNSSVRVGNDIVVKVLRRLQPGENPEDEVLRALSPFDHLRVSQYLGGLYWSAVGEEQYTVAIAQSWVPNRGDGWTWALEQLRGMTKGKQVSSHAISALRDLGVRTAELHLGLAKASGEAFGIHVAAADEVSQAQHAFRASLARSRDLVVEAMDSLPTDFREKVPAVLDSLANVEELVSGFAYEEGLGRVRVHGDYHLGQVLRTNDEDWTIIDFEGEPARTLEERRAHSSALRDVAGMLRSFSYARAVAERELSPDAARRDVLREWEQRARRAFVSGYRTTVASRAHDADVPLIPRSDHAFTRVLAAWEADKALYEVAYEARNRPEWIDIPLRALTPGIFDQV